MQSEASTSGVQSDPKQQLLDFLTDKGVDASEVEAKLNELGLELVLTTGRPPLPPAARNRAPASIASALNQGTGSRALPSDEEAWQGLVKKKPSLRKTSVVKQGARCKHCDGELDVGPGSLQIYDDQDNTYTCSPCTKSLLRVQTIGLTSDDIDNLKPFADQIIVYKGVGSLKELYLSLKRVYDHFPNESLSLFVGPGDASRSAFMKLEGATEELFEQAQTHTNRHVRRLLNELAAHRKGTTMFASALQEYISLAFQTHTKHSNAQDLVDNVNDRANGPLPILPSLNGSAPSLPQIATPANVFCGVVEYLASIADLAQYRTREDFLELQGVALSVCLGSEVRTTTVGEDKEAAGDHDWDLTMLEACCKTTVDWDGVVKGHVALQTGPNAGKPTKMTFSILRKLGKELKIKLDLPSRVSELIPGQLKEQSEVLRVGLYKRFYAPTGAAVAGPSTSTGPRGTGAGEEVDDFEDGASGEGGAGEKRTPAYKGKGKGKEAAEPAPDGAVATGAGGNEAAGARKRKAPEKATKKAAAAAAAAGPAAGPQATKSKVSKKAIAGPAKSRKRGKGKQKAEEDSDDDGDDGDFAGGPSNKKPRASAPDGQTSDRRTRGVKLDPAIMAAENDMDVGE